MNQRFAIGPRETATLNTDGIRAHFLVENIFVPGEICLTYTHYDRMIVGGAQPTDAALALPCPESLKVGYFLERRELGVLNGVVRARCAWATTPTNWARRIASTWAWARPMSGL